MTRGLWARGRLALAAAWALAAAALLARHYGADTLAAWARASWLGAALLGVPTLAFAAARRHSVRAALALAVATPVALALAAGLAGHAAWPHAFAVAMALWLPAMAGLGWAVLAGVGLDAMQGTLLVPVWAGLGLGAYALLGYLCGLAGSMAAALVLPPLAGWGCLWLFRGSLAGRLRGLARGLAGATGTWPRALAAGFAWSLALMLLYACTAPTTGWDALSTHLAVPQSWIRLGRVTGDPMLGNWHLPPFAFAVNLQALLAGAEQAGRMAHAAALLGSAALAGHLARRLGWPGFWAAALVFLAIPFSPILVSDGMIDYHQVLLVGAGMVVMAEMALPRTGGEEKRAAVAAGCLFGLGLLVKPQAGLYPAALACAMAIAGPARANVKGYWQAWGAAAAAALALALVWIVPQALGPQGFVMLGHMRSALPGGGTPTALTFTPPAHGWREVLAFVWGVGRNPQAYGPMFLALVPAGLVLAGLGDRRLALAAALAGAASFWVTSLDRWYLPLFPFAAAWTAAAVAGPAVGAWSRLAAAPALLLQVVVFLGFTLAPGNWAAGLGQATGAQPVDAFMAQRVDAWPALKAAGLVVPPGGRLALVGDSRSFLSPVPCVQADPVWHSQAFGYEAIHTPADLAARCAALHVTHVLFTYARPRSDPASPQRRAADPLWAAVEARGVKVLDTGAVRLTDIRPALARPWGAKP